MFEKHKMKEDDLEEMKRQHGSSTRLWLELSGHCIEDGG